MIPVTYPYSRRRGRRQLGPRPRSGVLGSGRVAALETGSANQEWRLVQKDSGYFSIEARHSGKCLSVNAQSTDNGAALVQ
ncbi:RICIN domain-containing protein [Streptomyces bobili]|uniref:RICIN domain-containing protein n=1 Tax=Streptomyces bobili TaxID=67280 RepID=UPI0033AD3918